MDNKFTKPFLSDLNTQSNDLLNRFAGAAAELKVIAALICSCRDTDNINENKYKKLEITSNTKNKNEIAHLIFTHLNVEDFSDPNFRIIFKTIQELYTQNQKFDEVILAPRIAELTICRQYNNDPYLYLTSITKQHDSNTYIYDYIKEIKTLTNLRKINQLFERFRKFSISGCSPNEQIANLQQKITEIINLSSNTEDTSIKARVAEFCQDVLVCSQLNYKPVVASGYQEIDQLTGGGWRRGDLIIVAARPGVGKTAFALNLALNASRYLKTDEVVAFFSLEMNTNSLMQRLIAANSGLVIDWGYIHNWTKEKRETILNASKKLETLPLHLIHQTGPTVAQIEECLHKIEKENKKIGLVIVDYLQLIRVPNVVKNNAYRYLEVSEACRQLKEMADIRNIPLIACSQLNRRIENAKGDDSKPRLADLRDSGTIEQDAALVSFLYTDDKNEQKSPYYQVNKEVIVTWQLLKHRNGQKGNIQFKFENSISRFSPLISQNVSSCFTNDDLF